MKKPTKRRTKQEKAVISLSCSMVCRLRKLPAYRGYNKNELVQCQARHEGVAAPHRKDHTARLELLLNLARRLGIDSAPTLKRKVKKQSAPYKKYNDDKVFTEWRLVRYEALKRSQGRCECCGNTARTSGEPLHVDHIKPKSIFPQLQYALSNLQVLCADCNIGKGAWDMTDWRSKNDNEEARTELDRHAVAEARKRGL